jgi:hypothetical protein
MQMPEAKSVLFSGIYAAESPLAMKIEQSNLERS